MTDISAGGEAIVLKFWHCAPGAKAQFMFKTLFPQTFKFPDIIKQSLRQGQVHVKETMLYREVRFNAYICERNHLRATAVFPVMSSRFLSAVGKWR